MTDCVFSDKARPPDDSSLRNQLGTSKMQWDATVALLEAHEGLRSEWKFYGAKMGWQLKVAQNRRAVVYLIPRAGHFMAALALKDEEIAALRESDLPPAFVSGIENAKRYPEGRPARVEVRGKLEADLVARLLAIRLSAQSASRPK